MNVIIAVIITVELFCTATGIVQLITDWDSAATKSRKVKDTLLTLVIHWVIGLFVATLVSLALYIWSLVK